ncbi:MAG: ATP synthase F1 subunit delta [Gemmataceae bacterium]|nr:ATP synthase F1 subunit delta [Gemmataceae bacterium]
MDIDQQPDIVAKPVTADVGAQQVAGVYAEALLNAAEKRGQVDEVYAELRELVEKVAGADPQLAAFFMSGTIGRDRRGAALRSAFEGRCSELLFNFLLVLNDHERLELIRPIRAMYRRLRDQRARRMRVQVYTAAPLADDQRRRLEQEVRDALHLEPVLETHVETDLIGGLIVRVNDWVYDGSIRTRLETIRKQLIERSSHEIQSRRDRFSSADGN